ncbi:uncharacterized protein ARB_00309 [Trichophyton benhamiae CBS 112371]|uniref:Uncharacterized protein n=1 Tax=Arthroderma benhamiae (strain ATCC MYA-4681 / CBS 112371) TaxID=663331 RepID=D4AVU5_ARTBC|nr:uncharacterized protein ARB_00309 [Trichophyton benhamiae CBS 112371]EFE32851.1 hypothetical protein ARB_00309 [Trichophyton benhamiae CBS 112371]
MLIYTLESDAVWFSPVPSSTLLLLGFVLLFIPRHFTLSEGVQPGRQGYKQVTRAADDTKHWPPCSSALNDFLLLLARLEARRLDDKADDHVTVTRIYVAPAPLPFRPRPGRESRTATPAQEEASPSTAAAVAVASR